MAALLVSLAVMSVLDEGGASGVAASGPAREGSGARLSRRTVRARDPAVGDEDGTGLAAAELRHAGPAEIPPEEIQGPDDRGRRVPAAVRRREHPSSPAAPQPGGRGRAAVPPQPAVAAAWRRLGHRSLARSDRRAAAGFSASPARARKPRSASTTAARTTTSGASSTPAPRPLPAEAVACRIRAAVAAVRCPAAGCAVAGRPRSARRPRHGPGGMPRSRRRAAVAVRPAAGVSGMGGRTGSSLQVPSRRPRPLVGTTSLARTF